MVLEDPLGSSASAWLSKPQGLTVVACPAQTPACCRLRDMRLPKPVRWSWTQFLNSCSFSQPQSQRLSSCIAHSSKDKLDLSQTGVFWQGSKSSSIFIKHEKELHIQTKLTASCVCCPASADCWAIT